MSLGPLPSSALLSGRSWIIRCMAAAAGRPCGTRAGSCFETLLHQSLRARATPPLRGASDETARNGQAVQDHSMPWHMHEKRLKRALHTAAAMLTVQGLKFNGPAISSRLQRWPRRFTMHTHIPTCPGGG
jgi:hypothetical protein